MTDAIGDPAARAKDPSPTRFPHQTRSVPESLAFPNVSQDVQKAKAALSRGTVRALEKMS
jgi:hypothetical protein